MALALDFSEKSCQDRLIAMHRSICCTFLCNAPKFSYVLRFTFYALALLLLGTASAPAADNAVPRPNILFCIADDWSWPHAGAYGDRVVKTPNFDRVAREGALF